VNCHQSVAELSRQSVKSANVPLELFARVTRSGFYLLARSVATATLKKWSEELMRNEWVIAHTLPWTLSRPRIQ